MTTRRTSAPTSAQTRAATTAQTARHLLRHACAVAAYRGAKAMRGAPASFGDFTAGAGTRTPREIVSHMADLYAWALTMASGAVKWVNHTPGTWAREVARFHRELARFDAHLASRRALHVSAERLMAGPVADSLQHIGQLTMLRRLAGAPIRGENYAKATIVSGRVGASQAKPVYEFG